MSESLDDLFDAAVRLLKEGNPEAAREVLQPLAKADHADSLYLLGLITERWARGQLDAREAFDLYHRAASRGHPRALCRLGRNYVTDPDWEGREYGFSLLQQAAELGDAEAMFHIGRAYAYGMGVEPDEDERDRWYFAAAERGNAEAQHQVAFMYELEDCHEQAAEWYLRAAEQGHRSAQ